ncbi:MAG: bifunctional sulfate adenylyltransferase/adenylylsulfate kinase [Gammaproteobacteria bacterium]|nr:bifunctional sulfate adenylyltransferase/adenylylsulfate kinase [Gammaproteobacteria bacterium]MDH3411629.1 bifunctional sulfate adenylyltransferase/adenylylsulfate kinase [Gammaproteobacteria bacterium]
MGAFKEPHGGELRELYLGESAADAEKVKSKDYKSWDLTDRQLCDMELILNGAFSPLEGFMCQKDYDKVLAEMRLASGLVWPIPITLDVTRAFADEISEGKNIALRDREGVVIATMEVEEIWIPDKHSEASAVFETENPAHPGVDYLIHRAGDVYVGGKLRGIEPPTHYDFKLLRDSPSELRGRFRKLGWRKVVAFQTRNPMHRAHQELTFRAAREHEANLLIHPVVGMTKNGDVDHFTRVRCYERILETYPEQTTTLSILNLAMRMAGPREALWHGIIRKNFGCTHFIVGRDHAGPGATPEGQPFYPPYAAQELFSKYENELDITMIPFQQMVYVEDKAQYMPVDETTPEMKIRTITGTEFRRRMQEGLDIPDWFSFPEVIEELRHVYPPRDRQGFTVFFTGLSGSGKSTIANALLVKMLENGSRKVTLLDGDLVRKHLSSELGFSREHRDLNILRIGYVAAEITKNGGVAICAPIAPYHETRRTVREMISAEGGFIEIYVSTPLDVCEARDRKGLYAKARAGLLKNFTGIDDPYEEPENPEMVIDTRALSAELAAHRILVKLESMGYIR